jgi:hypothetical protein
MNKFHNVFGSRRGCRFFGDQHLDHGLGKAASDRPGVRLAANRARFQPAVATTTDQMAWNMKYISKIFTSSPRYYLSFRPIKMEITRGE